MIKDTSLCYTLTQTGKERRVQLVCDQGIYARASILAKCFPAITQKLALFSRSAPPEFFSYFSLHADQCTPLLGYGDPGTQFIRRKGAPVVVRDVRTRSPGPVAEAREQATATRLHPGQDAKTPQGEGVVLRLLPRLVRNRVAARGI